MGKFVDLIGKTFGELIVIKSQGKNSFGHSIWRCQCSCGNETSVTSGNLRSGSTGSCGCIFRAMIGDMGRRSGVHRMSSHPLYSTWHNMIRRCYEPRNCQFDNYGGRGIAVCERWLDVRNFVEDMGERPDGMTLERIEVNGNYEPGNCRWATPLEQAQNARSNLIPGGLAAAARAAGVIPSTAYSRLRRGLSIDEALRGTT